MAAATAERKALQVLLEDERADGEAVGNVRQVRRRRG